MVHAHQRSHPQDNLFGDQKFWRTNSWTLTRSTSLSNRSIHSWEIHRFNFQRILKHPTADAYYDTMLPTRGQFQKIALPILTITGQYDGDELGALTYYGIISQMPRRRRAPNIFLIIGPWDHPGTRTPTE